MSSGANVYTQGFGSAPLAALGCIPIVSTVSPSSTNVNGPAGNYAIGQEWVNTTSNTTYVLTSLQASNGQLSATWTPSAGSGGVLSVSGTTNQVTASPSTGSVVVSIPTTFIAPGSIAASSTVTAGTGLVSTLGNLQLLGAASRVLINASTPSTAAVGFLTLTGSTPFVLTSSAITANSVILLTLKTLGTVTSASTITYIPTAGSASLTISAPTDTSIYGYLIIN